MARPSPTSRPGKSVRARGWPGAASRPGARGGPAADALAESLSLARCDYWIIGEQVVDAARLWPALDGEAREEAAAKARLLWEVPMLRPRLTGVLNTPGGAELLTSALDDGERRALNRWVFSTRRQ